MAISSHPGYARCNTSLVTDKMRDKGYMQANKSQFACSLGTKQPPTCARLSRKRKVYKSRLVSAKLKVASEKLGAMDWKVPSPEALMENQLTKFVHSVASDYGFDGTIKALLLTGSVH